MTDIITLDWRTQEWPMGHPDRWNWQLANISVVTNLGQPAAACLHVASDKFRRQVDPTMPDYWSEGTEYRESTYQTWHSHLTVPDGRIVRMLDWENEDANAWRAGDNSKTEIYRLMIRAIWQLHPAEDILGIYDPYVPNAKNSQQQEYIDIILSRKKFWRGSLFKIFCPPVDRAIRQSDGLAIETDEDVFERILLLRDICRRVAPKKAFVPVLYPTVAFGADGVQRRGYENFNALAYRLATEGICYQLWAVGIPDGMTSFKPEI